MIRQKTIALLAVALVAISAVALIAQSQQLTQVSYTVQPELGVTYLPVSLGSLMTNTSGTNTFSGFVVWNTWSASIHTLTVSIANPANLSQAFSSLELVFRNGGGPRIDIDLNSPTSTFSIPSEPYGQTWDLVVNWQTSATLSQQVNGNITIAFST